MSSEKARFLKIRTKKFKKLYEFAVLRFIFILLFSILAPKNRFVNSFSKKRKRHPKILSA
jgi:hypothetical protein